MPVGTLSTNISIGGLSLSGQSTRTNEGTGTKEVTLPAAKAGTLTARTDNDTGSATLSGGHGITDGLIVDVYWATGARYGMTVGTVATNVVPLDGGSGDNLPSTSTALTVSLRTQITADIDGDNLSLIGMKPTFGDASSTAQVHAQFQDASNDVIADLELTANQVYAVDVAGGATNPFTGDPITKIYASQSDSGNTSTFQICWLSDSTP